jgi:hypothetical protein
LQNSESHEGVSSLPGSWTELEFFGLPKYFVTRISLGCEMVNTVNIKTYGVMRVGLKNKITFNILEKKKRK